MLESKSLSLSLAFGAALAMLAAPCPARAQDTTHAVRIGLTYQAGTKPGVVVLAVTGAWGDSIQGIIARDLDYGDRVNVIGLPGTPAARMTASTCTTVPYGTPLSARR